MTAVIRITAGFPYIDNQTPQVLAWVGPCPWPSLPRPGDSFECCSDAGYPMTFKDIYFRMVGGNDPTVADVDVDAGVEIISHLMTVHDFQDATE